MPIWTSEQAPSLLGSMTLEAIASYAKMAMTLPVPESFIRDICAYKIFSEYQRRVSIELPARTFLYSWNIDRNRLSELGSFRVDLAIFREQSTLLDPAAPNLEALVEFKLSTDRYRIAQDIRRLKTLCEVAMVQGDTKKASGYAIACPQYQALKMTNSALDDLSGRFPISFRKACEIELAEGIVHSVGVAVIDIQDCLEGKYG